MFYQEKDEITMLGWDVPSFKDTTGDLNTERNMVFPLGLPDIMQENGKVEKVFTRDLGHDPLKMSRLSS
jgi:hypothetical protein